MYYEHCVTLDGKRYCWNSAEKTVDEVTVKRLEISRCPAEVITSLMALMDAKLAEQDGDV